MNVLYNRAILLVLYILMTPERKDCDAQATGSAWRTRSIALAIKALQ